MRNRANSMAKSKQEIRIVTHIDISEQDTKQAIEILCTLDNYNSSLPLYVSSCDSILTFDNFNYLLNSNKDSLILSSTNPYSRLKPESFSYAVCKSTQNDLYPEILDVNKLSIKIPPDLSDTSSSIYFITGSFYFNSSKKANTLIQSLYDKINLVNNEKYLDSLFELLIPQTNLCQGFKVKTYNSLGTPDEYNTGNYFLTYLEKLN